jgi:hypothetical protein
MNTIKQFPELASVLEGADHVDVKVVEGTSSLREFIVGMISYQPAWVTFLYGVRAVFVRFLGMRQEGIPQAPHFRPEDLPMTPGKKVAFFTVSMTQEDRYWVAQVDDTHLSAALCVVMQPGTPNRFHVITVVHYHQWTGPIYFNVIRPFHHLVVGRMAQAGVNQRQFTHSNMQV